MGSAERGRDWSGGLPFELLQKISTNLTDICDYTSFRAVCPPWRSAASPSNLSPELPWLILTSDRTADTRHFLRLSSSEPQLRTLRLPEARDKSIHGSSDGWLVIQDRAPSASLLNPLTRAQIHLPPIPPYENPFPRILLSAASSSSDSVVVAYFWSSLVLSICRPGDEAWTKIPASIYSVNEFIYHNGRFYLLGRSVVTAIFDPRTLEMVSVISPPPGDWDHSINHHLVESASGKLLLVVDQQRSMMGSEKFKVFELDQKSEDPTWSRVRNIGDSMLFMDEDHIYCFAASEFSGFRGNCIYYFGDCSREDVAGCDYRVCRFDVGDGSVQQLYKFQRSWIPEAFTWMVPRNEVLARVASMARLISKREGIAQPPRVGP